LEFSRRENLLEPLFGPETQCHLVDIVDRHRRPDEEARRLNSHNLMAWPHVVLFDFEVGISEVDVVELVVDKLPNIFVQSVDDKDKVPQSEIKIAHG